MSTAPTITEESLKEMDSWPPEKRLTEDEFIQAMEADPTPYKYSAFKFIPKYLRSQRMAEHWLEYAIKNTGQGGDHGYQEVAEIDPGLISDSFRFKAISHNVRALLHIKPSDTPAYRELVLHAIGISKFGFMMMDDSFKTSDLVLEVFNRHPGSIDLEWSCQSWVEQYITPEMKEALIACNFEFAFSVEMDVSPEQWTHLMKTQPSGYLELERRDRLELLDLFLAEGHWPKGEGFFYEQVHTAGEAANEFLKRGSDDPAFVLYRAKLKSYPTLDVIKVLNKPATMEILFGLYPLRELRKYGRYDKALHGALLENDLGM
ncbi:hypothetical protein [Pseudomonas putida]|uniref:Uncharacterized protein n=1 Tax=Pseudomonas putida TaxID=303 RepID=A0A8I1JHZ7_PSEPU|nr:hypothetical protein [Pseudomonas putida]MBI6883191.1 hypothetical protein [Pseudomonas putida]